MTDPVEKGAPEVMVWHDEADRYATGGALDPPDACMCRDCVLPPAKTGDDDHRDPTRQETP